jgi:hypothetical protein
MGNDVRWTFAFSGRLGLMWVVVAGEGSPGRGRLAPGAVPRCGARR